MFSGLIKVAFVNSEGKGGGTR